MSAETNSEVPVGAAVPALGGKAPSDFPRETVVPLSRRFGAVAGEAVRRLGEGANLFGCSCITQCPVLLRWLGRQMWRGRVLCGISCCDG